MTPEQHADALRRAEGTAAAAYKKLDKNGAGHKGDAEEIAYANAWRAVFELRKGDGIMPIRRDKYQIGVGA